MLLQRAPLLTAAMSPGVTGYSAYLDRNVNEGPDTRWGHLHTRGTKDIYGDLVSKKAVWQNDNFPKHNFRAKIALSKGQVLAE